MYTIQSIDGDIAWVEYNGETMPAPVTDELREIYRNSR